MCYALTSSLRSQNSKAVMPPSVVVIGSGITGLSVALALSRIYDVTIVARDLVGDNESRKWASPWAGAGWRPHRTTSEEDIAMQKASFRYMWKLAETNPETSLRRMLCADYYDEIDDTNMKDVWYMDFMPDCRKMNPSELPEGVTLGFEYRSLVMTPTIYLDWIKTRLDKAGVKFIRKELGDLSEALDLDTLNKVDVVVNATGVGAKYLGGVMDENVQEVRGQTMVVKTKSERVVCRSGKVYAYSIPRGDGTAVIGGITQFGNTDTSLDPSLRPDILRRARLITPPGTYPETVEELEIVDENVGIRPGRLGGVRVEKEVLTVGNEEKKIKVVHAYGVGGTGFKYSAGVAKRVAELVDEFVFGGPVE